MSDCFSENESGYLVFDTTRELSQSEVLMDDVPTEGAYKMCIRDRDFKSRVSTYSTTAACPPIAGDIKLHNKCQHINTAYGLSLIHI